MNHLKIIIAILLLCFVSTLNAQLGFCTGSKGEPIFTENFGNGTNHGPPLPPGTTNYNFVAGTPNDGSYTLFYRTNLNPSWHFSLDRTPDATNGINGKALIVNADQNTSGDFYRRVVSGLCVNTTFEFSAWVMNVYNPNSGVCGAGEIPVNVRFEIWNANETVLLGAGNTGNIMGTFSPIWQQYALVFTTGTETSVVLKMKNNGVGGCGNDLAIDDIEFRACGDLTTASSPGITGNIIQVCNEDAPVSMNLQAATTGNSNYFYQWQSSTNGTLFTDIPGENLANYIATNLTSTTYFRVKAAQDASNLNNNFCSTVSNVFTVAFLNPPNPPVSTGDAQVCINGTIPALSVTTNATSSVNWFDAPVGGNLIQSNSLSYIPAAAGTYYAEAFDVGSNCKSESRTPVTLNIIPLPTASLTSVESVCPGNSAVINFNGTPNATITYTFNGGVNQEIILNGEGFASLTSPELNTDTTYTLVNVSAPELVSCIQNLGSSLIIEMIELPTASISGGEQLCLGDTGTVQFTGTPNATVSYTVNNGPTLNLTLNALGEEEVILPNLLTNTSVLLTEVSNIGAGGCSQSLEIETTFTVVTQASATFSTNLMSACLGESIELSISGTPNTEVTFTVDNGPEQFINLNSNGTANLNTSAIISTTTFQLISATLLESPFCPQTLSESLTITTNPIPTADFNGNLNYCSGVITDINLTSNLVGTTFSWTVEQNGVNGATAGSGNLISQLLTANTEDGTVIYTVIPFLNGCAGNPIQIEVNVFVAPNPALTDGAICLQAGNSGIQSYIFDTGLNISNFSFEWYFEGTLIPNENGSTYEASQTGNFSVIVTNLVTGCISAVVSAMVTESVVGESLVIAQSEAFSNNPMITVTVVGGQGPFLYQLNDFGFQTSNVFYNVPAGDHIVTVVDNSLCTNLTASVTIINYPRFFTPNDDGYNDFWNITGVDDSSTIYIFDRYGKLLKQISPKGEGWDGTYNGELMNTSDYWFILNYPVNGELKTFKSHFTLKR